MPVPSHHRAGCARRLHGEGGAGKRRLDSGLRREDVWILNSVGIIARMCDRIYEPHRALTVLQVATLGVAKRLHSLSACLLKACVHYSRKSASPSGIPYLLIFLYKSVRCIPSRVAAAALLFPVAARAIPIASFSARFRAFSRE